MIYIIIALDLRMLERLYVCSMYPRMHVAWPTAE